MIPHRVSIHERPPMTEKDYEGDTIVSSWNTVSVVTLYNPYTMYFDTRKVQNLKPLTTVQAFQSMIHRVKIDSLTLDNGQENRDHLKLGINTFFCDPYASWQKPGIENGNRLLRRLIPKGSDIAPYSHRCIATHVKKMNVTPRKKLHWKTPKEVMNEKRLFKQ